MAPFRGRRTGAVRLAGVLAARGMADVEIGALERHAFYERARRAFAVVRTGELRPYGNVLLVKGTVNRYPPAAADGSVPAPR